MAKIEMSIQDYAGALELASTTIPALHPERKGRLNRSPLKNWIEKNGNLPTYINSIATALLRENPGWSISRVIATAVNAVKKMCATGKAFGGKGTVSKAVQSAACTAVAQWEKLKASASVELDSHVLELAIEAWGDELHKAKLRKSYREREEDIPDILQMSDDLFFAFIESDTDEPVELSWSSEEGVNDVDNIEAFMEVMELSASAQSAIKLPFNMSAMENIGGSKYRKEILRLGELVVDPKSGRKFKFTPEFLKGLKGSFGKVLDYVPLLFTNEKNQHVATGDPNAYGGVIEELSLDDEDNPTKLYGTFNLTEPTAQMVQHNPKYGVSVTAHPNFVDSIRDGQYHGPMLLNVAGTHDPKMNKMGSWEKTAVMASSEQQDFDVIDLSNESFIEVTEDIPTEGGNDMADELKLSNEQIQNLLSSDAVKAAISAEAKTLVDAAVADKDQQIQELSNQVGNLQTTSYKTIVKGAVDTFRGKGVPPVLCDQAEALMLSFGTEEQEQTIELSIPQAEGKEPVKEEVNKVMLVTRMLDEMQGFIDMSKEKGKEETEEVELSAEDRTAAVALLTGLTQAELAKN